ncbi:MGA_1079 family surface serine endopeptidase [Mesomycoplasma molare]|uniref:DUF31 domain-containing protein n=1 Tax=Mesomycoplasma molare TaxID=171288 RepID=A0ABY5TTZ8_9BACT|nr:hypothetical protein [Mesomycoplasma molare]UWD34138.1 hypothetical protein NX772_03565 [Mesomycoplasma molare]
MNKKKKIIITTSALLLLLVSGTAAGITASVLSSNNSNDKIDELKKSKMIYNELLNSKTIFWTEKLKETILNLQESSKAENNLKYFELEFVNKFRTMLVNLTSWNENYKKLNETKINSEFKSILDDALTYSFQNLLNEFDKEIKELNVENLNLDIVINKDFIKIEEQEKEIKKYLETVKNNEDYFNRIIDAKNTNLFTETFFQSVLNNAKNDLVKNKDFQNSAELFENIASIIKRNNEIIKSYDSKYQDDAKYQELKNEYLKYIENDKLNSSIISPELKENLEKTYNDIKAYITSKSENDPELKALKLSTKEKVANFNFLTDLHKQKYNEDIDASIIALEISEIEKLASQYNQITELLIEEISISENTKQTEKYLNASNKTEFDNLLSELLNFISNNHLKLDNNFLSNLNKKDEINEKILELRNLRQELNGDLSSAEMDEFRAMVESNLRVELNPNLAKYGLNETLFSASINEENKDILLSNNKITDVSLKIKELHLNTENFNELSVVYKAQSNIDKSKVVDVVKTLSFNNNVQEIINSINFNNLDEAFDFSYDELETMYKSDIENNFEKQEQLFKNKKRVINNFFTYRLIENSFSYDENKKITFKMGIFHEKDKIKELNLSTENVINFKSELLKKVTITPKDIWLNSKFYADPDTYYDFTNNEDFREYSNNLIQRVLFNHWFKKDVFEPIQKTFDDLKGKTLKTALDKLSGSSKSGEMTKEEIDRVFSKIFADNVLFNIEKEDGVTVENINFSDVDRYSISAEHYSIFKFRISKGNETAELKYYLNTSKTSASEQDLKDEQEILKFITEKETINKKEVSSAKKIFSNLKFKEKGRTHSLYNAKDAIKAFDESYILPKIGKYQIFVKEVKEVVHNSGATNGGQAKIFFWYKKNGVEVPLPRVNSNKFIEEHTKTINYFKPLSYRDIKPRNSSNQWFTQEDFNTSNIDENDKSIINKINSTNFDHRKVDGVIAKGNNLKFRVLDPKDIIDQNAPEMLNFLLQLKVTNQTGDSNNSGFTSIESSGVNKNPDDADVSQNQNKNSSGFFSSDVSISSPSDPSNDADTNRIVQNYFMYFYDVRNNAPGTITFKLGFINKQDTTKRYSNNKDITLVNLTNDYKENLYPEIILNSIKYSDLDIKNTEISTISANEFKSKVENNSSDLKRFVNFRNSVFTYNNFSINSENISILEVKNIENNSAYIRLKYTNPKNNNAILKGNNWYKITGFANSINQNENLTFERSQLQTIYKSSSEIKRTRELEPYYKDLMWQFDEKTEIASWTLDKKYIEKTFLTNSSRERKIRLHLYANTLVQNDFRLKNIIDEDRGYNFEFDFEQLISGQALKLRQESRQINKFSTRGDHPRFFFNISAKYDVEKGIIFSVEIEDKQYKLFIGNPYKEVITLAETRDESKFDTFDKNKAFLINNAGASIKIEYTNNIEHEDFMQQTNLFSYKNLDYNQENQPITFFTSEEVILDKGYNPNQNVPFELHNGYKQDNEFMHKSWKNIPLVNDVKSRAIAYGFGSATMFGKVSNDPSDGKFYIITNNHVQHVSKFTEFDNNLPISVGGKYIVRSGDNFDNNVEPGFSYWSGSNRFDGANVGVVWSGVQQLNKKGEENKTGNFVDVTVFIVDANVLIAKAKEQGKMDMVQFFENWFTIGNSKLDHTGVKESIILGPNIKNFALNGFPYGKQSGYIINRASTSTGNVGLFRQQGYAPSFFNAGNSGTGLIGDGGSYISTINSGAPLTFLQSWNYDTINNNYFGINQDNEDPLLLENTKSLFAQMLKLNIQKPLEYSIPWFIKKITK